MLNLIYISITFDIIVINLLIILFYLKTSKQYIFILK